MQFSRCSSQKARMAKASGRFRESHFLLLPNQRKKKIMMMIMMMMMMMMMMVVVMTRRNYNASSLCFWF